MVPGGLRASRVAVVAAASRGWDTPALPRPQQLALGVVAAVLAHAVVLIGLRPALLALAPSDVAAPVMTVRMLVAPDAPGRQPGSAVTPAVMRDRPMTAQPEAQPMTQPMTQPTTQERPAPAPAVTPGLALAREGAPPAPHHPLDGGRPAPPATESVAGNEVLGRATSAPAPQSAIASPAAAASTAPTDVSALLAPAAVSSVASSSAVPALAPAPDYLAAGRLDPGPRPLQEIEPLYPEAAGMRSGSVVLRVLIGASGGVDQVAVVRSAPPGLFDAAAMTAFASARFSPGLLLGAPVKSQITIQVDFTPINRGSAVSGRND